jgi:hypothetical protein
MRHFTVSQLQIYWDVRPFTLVKFTNFSKGNNALIFMVKQSKKKEGFEYA